MNTHPLFTAAENLLHQYDLNFEDMGDGQTLRFGLNLGSVTWTIHIIVDDQQPSLSVVGISDVLMPASNKEAMRGILNYINARATFGCFFLGDEDEDLITLRLSVPALPGASEGAVVDFGLSVCVKAIKQLSEPLAVCSLRGGSVESFREMLHKADEKSAGICADCRGELAMPPAEIIALN